MIKPKKLKPGDTIALLSPSWGGPAAFPAVYENGKRIIEDQFGFRVKEYQTTRLDDATLRANPALRAKDLNAAFTDPEVKGIIATIGGNDSIRILEHLDRDLILSNPKLIMGYSDSTAYLSYIGQMGLTTFYGPSVMAGFSYLENFPEVIEEYKRFLFQSTIMELTPYASWSDAYENWGKADGVGKLAARYSHDLGHRWINQGTKSRGPLWGGCFELLEMMNGTFAWPPRGFWEGKILFMETSEEKPTPEHVGDTLRNFGIQGILSGLSGLLVGRPKSYSEEEKKRLDDLILEVVAGEFGRKDLTIVTNLDMGHTDPRHIFPLGIEAELDPFAKTIRITEEAFEG